MQRDEEAASRTIVFIHGGWLTPTCWDPFVSFFESKGYRCLAPAWPGKDRPVEAIQADPSPLAGLGMGEIIDHYDRIIGGSTSLRSSSVTRSARSLSRCSSTAGSGRRVSPSTRPRPRASSHSIPRRSWRSVGSS